MTPQESAKQRIARKIVHEANGCWVWQGHLMRGYGRLRFEGKTWAAHRVSFTVHRGPIPEGLHLDHLCRNPPCVNPDHLEPVTHRENVLRGVSPPAKQAQQTHCSRGHDLSGSNLRTRSDGVRQCRACQQLSDQKRNRRRRAEMTRQRRAIRATDALGDASKEAT